MTISHCFIQITRCPIESESYLSWEDQEPELPVDTDESTEETYCDEVTLLIRKILKVYLSDSDES